MFELFLTSCILHRRLCQLLKSNHKSQTGATRCFRRKPMIDRSFWELLHFGNVSIDAETQPQNSGADSRLFSPSHEGNLLSPWDQTKSTIMCLCVYKKHGCLWENKAAILHHCWKNPVFWRQCLEESDRMYYSTFRCHLGGFPGNTSLAINLLSYR